ncbi:MAG: hypothetical protein PHF37_00440 [Phycisphaerae bacterium]|nr:hypothetical protein [Phycisphaerae bacterium]
MPYPLKKAVSRESNGLVREAGKVRQIIIILEPPNLIGLRAKGCRKVYYLPADACYSTAVKAEMAAIKREKVKNKKQKRKF